MRTRKFFLAIIMIAFLAGTALAGDFFTIGINNSFNLSNVKMYETIEGRIDYPLPETSFKTGFAVGAYCNIPVSEYISIQPEVFYTNQGFVVSIDSMNFKSTTSMNYIEMPLLTVFKIVDHFSVFLGPSVSFYLNGKVHEGKTEESKLEWFAWDDISNKDTRAVNLGFVGGCELSIDRYSFGVRYNLGLNNEMSSSDVTVQHRGIQVVLGIDLY